jgi:hypothetical protein
VDIAIVSGTWKLNSVADNPAEAGHHVMRLKQGRYLGR